MKNPGSLYFGALSTPNKEGSANLRLYHHVMVFLPYFSSDGTFHCVVMDTGEEISVETLAARFPSSAVHLVRVRPMGLFLPPPLAAPEGE